jgi:putative iron-dependent peroxidase
MGRIKADSVEIENKAPDSHVASTDQDTFGKVFRPCTKFWRAWPGLKTDKRGALTRYTKPLTGAYYLIPSIEVLRQPDEDEDSRHLRAR